MRSEAAYQATAQPGPRATAPSVLPATPLAGPVLTSPVGAFGQLAVGIHPRIEPRLVRTHASWEDADAYRAAGGYQDAGADRLLDVVERAGLRGRGGAAFPTAVKLRSVAAGAGPRYVVANGEEGEPASVKDRWLLRNRPHLVVDGLLLAAAAVGADGAYVYVSDPIAAGSVEHALGELDRTPVPVRVHTVERGYVAGEETSVVRAINGGPAKPLDKPPRPFEQGVDGQPTLVSNVETLANIALLTNPATPTADTFLLTVSGACTRPGLYEVPYGVELGATTELLAGATRDVRGYLMGGFFGGLLGPAAAGHRLDVDELRAHGTGLGCGAVVVLGPDDCPVGAAADVMAYFGRENADQCGSCIRGTSAMGGVLADLCRGATTTDQLGRLEKWSTSLRGRGACGTLDGAAILAASLLSEFATDVAAHLAAPCTRCADRPPATRTRFALDAALSPSMGAK